MSVLPLTLMSLPLGCSPGPVELTDLQPLESGEALAAGVIDDRTLRSVLLLRDASGAWSELDSPGEGLPWRALRFEDRWWVLMTEPSGELGLWAGEGEVWESIEIPDDSGHPSMFVALGSLWVSYGAVLLRWGPDGMEEVPLPDADVGAVLTSAGSDVGVAVGWASEVRFSEDGDSWEATHQGSEDISALSWTGEEFVAFEGHLRSHGEARFGVAVSETGVDWRVTEGRANPDEVVAFDGRWYAGGSQISVSSDLQDWTEVLANPAFTVAVVGDRLVAGGLGGAWSSTDGEDWVEEELPRLALKP